MDQRAHKLAVDAAEWDAKIGWMTGVFLTLLRVVALIGFVVADGPRATSLGLMILAQTLLAAVFTFGVWQRRPSAAIALAVLYGVGYLYSWFISARLLPPLALIGVLLWYGLYRGIRGTRALVAMQGQISAPAI
jgi:hypothetical protein